MPPRKSNVSVASVGPEDGADVTPAKAGKDGMSVEDLSLPKSMIARLAKGVLPANTQIHKDALLALHKSATVFVSYIASTSNENAQSNGKKTIAPQDVMAALKDCELEEFLPRLEAELRKYNEVQCDKRNTYRRKVKEEKEAAAAPPSGEGAEALDQGETTLDGDTSMMTNGHEDEGDRPAKKLKGVNGAAALPGADDVEDEEMDGAQDEDDHQDEEEEEEAEGDAGEDEDEEMEEDPGAQLIDDYDDDEDEVRVTGHGRDEALDEHESESD